MINFKNKLFRSVADALFPERLTCELCGKEVFNKEFLCEDCIKSVNFSGDDICLKCGRPNKYKPSACPSCKEERDIDLSRSAFAYEKGGEELVKKFKYSDARYMSKTLAGYMKNVYVNNYFAPDIICYVPMTDVSLFKRGFNQAEFLAKDLAELVGMPCSDILEKVSETPHQAGLGATKRRKNLQNAYAIKRGVRIKNKKILLIDDVLTTGATAGEIAALMKKRGAKSVYLLTLAAVDRTTTDGAK